MAGRAYNVLFLCTHNSARSIIAEVLLNQLGSGRFQACSAESHPGTGVNPLVLKFLRSKGLDVAHARSKSWEEFAPSDAPRMDLIITVCDRAAAETCPVWLRVPATAHWSAPDPAVYVDDAEQAKRMIGKVFQQMQRRISLLVGVPSAKLDGMSLQAHARAIADKV